MFYGILNVRGVTMENNIMALIINGNYGANKSPDGQIDFLLQGKIKNGILENQIVSYSVEELKEEIYKPEFTEFSEEEKEILHEVYYRKYMREKFSRILSTMPIDSMKEPLLAYLLSKIQCILVRFSEYAVTITMPNTITEKQIQSLLFIENYIEKNSNFFTSIYKIKKDGEMYDTVERRGDSRGAIEEYIEKYVHQKGTGKRK